MSASETHLLPDEVLSAATRTANVSRDLKARIQELVEQIRNEDVEAACGNDESGRAFLESYNPGAAEDVMAGGEEICGAVYDIAENVGVGVIETDLQDQEDARRIQALADDLIPMGAEAALQNDATVDQVNDLMTRAQNPEALEIIGDAETARVEGFVEDVNRVSE